MKRFGFIFTLIAVSFGQIVFNATGSNSFNFEKTDIGYKNATESNFTLQVDNDCQNYSGINIQFDNIQLPKHQISDMELCFHIQHQDLDGINKIMFVTDVLGNKTWTEGEVSKVDIKGLFSSDHGFTDRFYLRSNATKDHKMEVCMSDPGFQALLNMAVFNSKSLETTPIGFTLLMEGLQYGKCEDVNVSAVNFCSTEGQSQPTCTEFMPQLKLYGCHVNNCFYCNPEQEMACEVCDTDYALYNSSLCISKFAQQSLKNADDDLQFVSMEYTQSETKNMVLTDKLNNMTMLLAKQETQNQEIQDSADKMNLYMIIFLCLWILTLLVGAWFYFYIKKEVANLKFLLSGEDSADIELSEPLKTDE